MPSSAKKTLSALASFLPVLFLSSLACDLSTPPQATPTRTFTPNPTSTVTATSTFAPIPTGEGSLSAKQRSNFSVILRSPDPEIHERFYGISGYLHDRGYSTDIDTLLSAVGAIDIILYGAPSCLDAVDDLAAILQGRLDLAGMERRRFGSDDAYYEWKVIIIQITSPDRFQPPV